MSIELVMPSNHLVLMPSIFPTISIFSNESALRIRWPKNWSFSINTLVLPMNIQDWFPLGLTGWISLLLKRLSRVFSNTTVQNKFFRTQHSLWSNSHPYMTTGKTIALTIWVFVGKVMSPVFNMLSRFFIAFLPRGKRLLISWLQSPFAVIL